MLGEPDGEVYAFSGKMGDVETYQVDKEQALEEMLPRIQIMKYDIGALTKDEYVDPVTLMLSLDTVDDRMEIFDYLFGLNVVLDNDGNLLEVGTSM